jgi:hypothetical protein
MGWLSTLIGNSGEGVAKPIEAFGKAADSLFTSDDERLSRQEMQARIAQQPASWQNELNKLNALSDSIFIAGWRPFIGWVCGVSLSIYYIPQFILGTYIWAKLCLESSKIQAYPVSSDNLMELVISLLGLGVLRSVDKGMAQK